MAVTILVGSIALAGVPLSGASGAMVQRTQTGDIAFLAEAKAMIEAAYPAAGPGAAVVVARGGRVLFASGQGLADMEARRSITPDTPFRLGSIAKQFTAALVLKLVEEGKLSLDDPISRFFPDWPKPGADATVRQLLNHSSGLQDFSKVPGWIARNRHRPWTTAELLSVSRDLPARAAPGDAWEYNNGGYVMLGAIVEKVTGKAWHQALEEKVTRPLGLRTIAYAVPSETGAAAARGYTEKAGKPQPIELSHMSIAHAAGGLQGSVADMAKWAQALHHGRVVTPVSYREMTAPARLADGSTRPYGFGLRLQEIRGRRAFVHGGAGGGLDTDSAYIPSEDIFVAVFANSDRAATDLSNLVRRLAALALREPIPSFTRRAPDVKAIAPLFGLFTAEKGAPARFFEREGKLYFGRGDDEREVFAAGEDRFFFGEDALVWFRIVPQVDGAHLMELHSPEASAPLRAKRSGPVPAAFAIAASLLQSYSGRYHTETLAVSVAPDGKGALVMIPQGQDPLSLRPVSDTEFRIDGAPMRVVFHREGGEVNRFTLYRGARELHGRRVSR